jgi:hypothetical protein
VTTNDKASPETAHLTPSFDLLCRQPKDWLILVHPARWPNDHHFLVSKHRPTREPLPTFDPSSAPANVGTDSPAVADVIPGHPTTVDPTSTSDRAADERPTRETIHPGPEPSHPRNP